MGKQRFLEAKGLRRLTRLWKSGKHDTLAPMPTPASTLRKEQGISPSVATTNTSIEPSTSEPMLDQPYGVLEWSTSPQPIMDICFVHGLIGDRNRTWTAAGEEVPWPKLLLAPELKNARILTYGYDAYPTRRGMVSGNRVTDHASNLLADLTTNRASCQAQTRPLVFIVHSLGGIVCKKAILLSRDHHQTYYQGIFNCCKGIVFLGTPHTGSWMANWAQIPASALGVMKSINKPLLDILGPDSELLESIQVDFTRLLLQMASTQSRLEIACFFEELPLPVVGKAVAKDSATIPGYNSISIHADHREMVRFNSPHDRGFTQILGFVKRWQEEVRYVLCSIASDLSTNNGAHDKQSGTDPG